MSQISSMLSSAGTVQAVRSKHPGVSDGLYGVATSLFRDPNTIFNLDEWSATEHTIFDTVNFTANGGVSFDFFTGVYSRFVRNISQGQLPQENSFILRNINFELLPATDPTNLAFDAARASMITATAGSALASQVGEYILTNGQLSLTVGSRKIVTGDAPGLLRYPQEGGTSGPQSVTNSTASTLSSVAVVNNGAEIIANRGRQVRYLWFGGEAVSANIAFPAAAAWATTFRAMRLGLSGILIRPANR